MRTVVTARQRYKSQCSFCHTRPDREPVSEAIPTAVFLWDAGTAMLFVQIEASYFDEFSCAPAMIPRAIRDPHM